MNIPSIPDFLSHRKSAFLEHVQARVDHILTATGRDPPIESDSI